MITYNHLQATAEKPETMIINSHVLVARHKSIRGERPHVKSSKKALRHIFSLLTNYQALGIWENILMRR